MCCFNICIFYHLHSFLVVYSFSLSFTLPRVKFSPSFFLIITGFCLFCYVYVCVLCIPKMTIVSLVYTFCFFFSFFFYFTCSLFISTTFYLHTIGTSCTMISKFIAPNAYIFGHVHTKSKKKKNVWQR